MERRERRGMASASLKWRLTFPTVREAGARERFRDELWDTGTV